MRYKIQPRDYKQKNERKNVYKLQALFVLALKVSTHVMKLSIIIIKPI